MHKLHLKSKQYNLLQAVINKRYCTNKVSVGETLSNLSKILGTISIITVIFIITFGSLTTEISSLPFSKLVVIGERHYTTMNDIRQAILALGKPITFMKCTVNDINHQIEQIPWIKQSSVRKQWPNKLIIRLVEYAPIAYWNNHQLIDRNGKIFSAPGKQQIVNSIMPILYGPEGSERDVLNKYLAINKLLIANNFKLKSISMSPRHSWQLVLNDSIRLELGREKKIKRLKRFIKIYPIILQRSQHKNKRISYVDLRYQSGLAIGWAKGSEAAVQGN